MPCWPGSLAVTLRSSHGPMSPESMGRNLGYCSQKGHIVPNPVARSPRELVGEDQGEEPLGGLDGPGATGAGSDTQPGWAVCSNRGIPNVALRERASILDAGRHDREALRG